MGCVTRSIRAEAKGLGHTLRESSKGPRVPLPFDEVHVAGFGGLVRHDSGGLAIVPIVYE